MTDTTRNTELRQTLTRRRLEMRSEVQSRIGNGIENGELTPREAGRLEGREAALNRSIARMRSDGSLSGRERLRIEKRQDRISRGIYRQKHDAQGR